MWKWRRFNRVTLDKKLIIVGNFNRKDGYTKHLFKLKDGHDRKIMGVLRKNCFAYIHY